MNISNYIKFMSVYGDNVNNILLPEKNKIQHTRIIGKAGIGKSTHISKNYSYADYLLLAYTGLAASQINGHTISSVFKLGRFNENPVNKSVSSMKWNTKSRVEHIQHVKGLVIDEFYTVPVAIMEKVNLICQQLRQSSELFGGLELILVGDDKQTECIDESFVESELYKNLEFKEIVLEEHDNMRLTYKYMNFCNYFRNNKLNRDKLFRLLNNNKFSQTDVNGYSVYYTNEEVNTKNNTEMKNFEGEIIYKTFKKGCPIYITSNWENLCNGMIGELVDKKDKYLHIKIEEKIYEVLPSQINFVPCFALSIHKSQAKTFPGINIYIKKNDIKNNRKKYIRLLYVALTRVRHFDKCYINIY